MKKIQSNRKLALNKNTLRILQSQELGAVQGGAPTETRQSRCVTACTNC